MPGAIATLPRLKFTDLSGAPLASGTLTTYLSGSTTKTPTWQDQALTILNTNPIVLDANGSCIVWLDNTKAYKIVLADKNGVVQWTQSNVVGGGVDASVVLNAALIQSAVDQAAASAAAALATKTSIDHKYRGALSADPATRTDGSANVVGDEYFSTGVVPNLLKRWNGSTWQASDINTADLAAAGGAGLVGFQQRGSGAQPRTLYDKLGESVSILDFIPKSEQAAIYAGTSTYDCRAALVNAMASVTVGTGYGTAGTDIYFPSGVYIFGGRVNLKKQVRLYGPVGGMPDGRAATLKFPADSAGLLLNAYNTLDGGLDPAAPNSVGADGSIIENLTIWGGGGTSTTAYGIWMRCRATLRNLQVRDFKGNNIHVVASAGGGGALEGNANNFHIQTIRTVGSGQHGLFVDGADANAGIIIGVDATSNAGWGVYDSSFLGNTYIACHMDANTLGAYKSDDANARNLFLGCYSEGGQPASSIIYPAQVIGGLHGAGVTGNFIDSRELPTQVQGSVTASTGETATASFGAVDKADGSVMMLTSSDEPSWPFRLKYKQGRWFVNHANSAYHPLMVYNQQATTANGYARNITDPGAIGFAKFFLGDYSQMRLRSVGSAAPTTGAYVRGDIVENLLPANGGFVGWVCTASGTPGDWKTYGAISA